MLKDGLFFGNSVTAENLNILSESISVECEKRICELYELAREAAGDALSLYNEGYGIYEILGIIGEGEDFFSQSVHNDVLEENILRLKSYLSALLSEDKAVFAELFKSKLCDGGIEISESNFLPGKTDRESFVYVKNRLADEAYDVFSQEFSSPRVSYVQSFRDAARAVATGESEYCLLPLEESRGARLASVAALLFADDLKINSVTPVFGFDGSADMKYALISRHFTVPAFNKDDDRYLEIRISAENAALLSEIFSAAEALGASVYRVNTVVFDTEDGEMPYFSVVFRKNGEDFSTLLVFLTLFCPTYTAVGIYKNLE